jgi:hypothetical protein
MSEPMRKQGAVYALDNASLNEVVEGFSTKVLDKDHTDAPDPFALPSASAATMINTLLKVSRPVAPPNSALPQ